MDIAKLRGRLFLDSYIVVSIFTVDSFRQKGLGSLLLGNVLNMYNRSHFYYCVTPSTNIASVNLARRCGFSFVGKIETYQFNKVG
jgi:L-amino acid N-acyltransferase YncA